MTMEELQILMRRDPAAAARVMKMDASVLCVEVFFDLNEGRLLFAAGNRSIPRDIQIHALCQAAASFASDMEADIAALANKINNAGGNPGLVIPVVPAIGDPRP